MARTGTEKAILLVDVDHLGHRGDLVNVARGYLRNYLVPRKLAEQATAARVAEVEKQAELRARQQARTLEEAQQVAAKLNSTKLKITAPAGAEGRLYGSITSADIADELWRSEKIRVDRRKVRLTEPIKALGSYLVEIDVFPEVRGAVTVEIAPFGFDA